MWKIEIQGTTEYLGDEPLIWIVSTDNNFPQRFAIGSLQDAENLREVLVNFLEPASK